jgi:hypothetical protein
MDDIKKLEDRIKDLLRNDHLFLADNAKGSDRDLVPTNVKVSHVHCWTER